MNTFKIWWDGFSSPHKKDKAGYAVVVSGDPPSTLDFKSLVELLPDTTSNQAEFMGLIRALGVAQLIVTRIDAQKDGACKFVFLGDSQLVVNSMKQKVRLKDGALRLLWHHANFARSDLEYFSLVDIKWVPREQNLAGKLLEQYRK